MVEEQISKIDKKLEDIVERKNRPVRLLPPKY